MTARAVAGHPIRAVSVIGLLAGMGLMYRLPGLEREFAGLARGLDGRQLAPGAPLLPGFGPISPPGVSVPPPLAAVSPPGAGPTMHLVSAPSDPRAPPMRPRGTLPSAPKSPPSAPISPPVPLPPPPFVPAPPGVATGGDLATAAYARLAAGDRRAAAGLFAAAIAAGADPRRGQWEADARALSRRWSGEAYVLFRRNGAGPPGPTASPVLGSGQLGANLAWTLDPLARRPVAVFARINAAKPGRIDTDSGQAAVGLRWKPLPGVTLAAERLIAIGPAAINDWSLRVAAGTDGARGNVEWHGYAEADLIGNGDYYAGAQARIGRRIATIGKARIVAGAGAWGSTEVTDRTLSRLDIGPGITATAPLGRVNIDIAADWRFRVAGNAAPVSGPVLTVSTGF